MADTHVKHLRNFEFNEIGSYLEEQRQKWGNQIHIGPPYPENLPGDLIGVYLDASPIPLE